MLNNEDGNVDSKSAIAKVKFVDNTANVIDKNAGPIATIAGGRAGRWIKTSCKDYLKFIKAPSSCKHS